MVRIARAIAGLACLVALVVPAAASGAPQALHYATAVKGTNAFVGIAKTGSCFKAYLSDGTGATATLSVWFQGCVDADGRLGAERGGIRLDAEVDRWRAAGTITLRDGRSFAFSAKSGDAGGIVGRQFKYKGRRYRSGWVVLQDERVRWRIMPIGRGLYGDPPAPSADACAAAKGERDLLRAQRGLLLHQSGVWEVRINDGRGPTGAMYNRLSWAISSLDERIFEIERALIGCP
jgi:hypothetical protein